MQGNQAAASTGPASARQIGKLGVLALPLALLAFLGLSPAPALAAKTHRLKATIPTANPSFGVAVEEASGNVFITTDCVVVTGPEGGAPSGVKAPICGLSALSGVAVDNSPTSPSKGALYVAEENGTVTKYVLEAEEYKAKGTLSATPAITKTFGLAVDAKGNVFVADNSGKAVVEFSSTGTQLARLDISATVGAPATVAVDSAGDLLLGNGQGAVYRFDANGSGEVEAGTEPAQVVEGGAFGVAVDPGSDDLYVAMLDEGNRRVDQYSATCPTEGSGSNEHCVAEGEFGRGTLINPARVAVNSATGLVYVADLGNGGGNSPDVAVFGPTLIVPRAVSGAASNVAGISATLNGTINPAGSLIDECKFEWGTTTAYGNVTSCAESVGSGTSPVPVHADISPLGIGTKYHFRLVATNPNTEANEKGPSVGADKSFVTRGPQIHAEAASQISDTAARLEGLVNPEKQATSYFFEYVSEDAFNEDQFTQAIVVPLGGEAIGSGSEDVEVAQQVAGLLPATTYHFRISATNHCNPNPEEECTAKGPGRTFTTYLGQAPGLPYARAYEQVSPLDKNGVAPAGSVNAVQSALDGHAITYASGGGIPGAEGAQQYPLYLAGRGADWSTQGLLPPAKDGASAAVLGWSEDLAKAYDTQAILPGSPAGLRERDSASHALRTIVGEEGDTRIDAFVFVDATPSGSTVAFESSKRLAVGGAAAKGAFNTYAWDEASGELVLAGVLNSGSAPSKGSLAGSNEAANHTHYTQAQQTLSEDGSRLFFTDAGTNGQLFVRQNPFAAQSELVGGVCSEPELACTIEVSASQKTVPDPTKKPASFWGATPDGSAALFTSARKLTDDATTGPGDEGNDLYRYDLGTGKLTDLVPDLADPKGAEVQGVLGYSDDGSYVYFAANGKFDTAPSTGNCAGTSGSCNLYLWHEAEGGGTSTTFIARMELGASPDSTNWASAVAGSQEFGNTARVSPDGQTLLFRSRGQLGAYDNKGTPEFYRYRVGGQPQCVSCNPTEAAPVGAPTPRSIATNPTVPPPASILSRNLSADGDRVFFETPDQLVATDLNGVKDVYEWEAEGSGSCASEAQDGGCLFLVSSGTSPEASFFADADEEGENAFFFTGSRLVGQDKDQIVDIYDARVGGGIASQNPPPLLPPCEGEACKGAVPPTPGAESPGSASFSGPGNPKPSPNKKHHKKKHHKKKKHQSKRHTARKQG